MSSRRNAILEIEHFLTTSLRSADELLKILDDHPVETIRALADAHHWSPTGCPLELLQKINDELFVFPVIHPPETEEEKKEQEKISSTANRLGEE